MQPGPELKFPSQRSTLLRLGACCALWLAIGSCAGSGLPAAAGERGDSIDATSCNEVLQYETADAHPEIKWISPRKGVSANAALSCMLRAETDDGDLETKAYMSSGLYRFLRECRSEANTVYRLFMYKKSGLPYLLRLHTNQFVDPYTYIVVRSYTKPAGNLVHSIGQRSNDASRITLCPPDAPHGAAGGALPRAARR